MKHLIRYIGESIFDTEADDIRMIEEVINRMSKSLKFVAKCSEDGSVELATEKRTISLSQKWISKVREVWPEFNTIKTDVILGVDNCDLSGINIIARNINLDKCGAPASIISEQSINITELADMRNMRITARNMVGVFDATDIRFDKSVISARDIVISEYNKCSLRGAIIKARYLNLMSPKTLKLFHPIVFRTGSLKEFIKDCSISFNSRHLRATMDRYFTANSFGKFDPVASLMVSNQSDIRSITFMPYNSIAIHMYKGDTIPPHMSPGQFSTVYNCANDWHLFAV